MAVLTSKSTVCKSGVKVSNVSSSKTSRSVRLAASQSKSVGAASLRLSQNNQQLLAAVKGKRNVPASTRSHGGCTTVAGALEAGVGLFGTKAGMTQIFSGKQTYPCTIIALEAGNIVTQVKTEETDGYTAVQVGYRVCRDTKITQPERGHLDKSGAPSMRHLEEFRVKSIEGYEAGQQLKVEDMLKEGDLVDVQGKSIGKGFQGGIKRHNFKRGLMTHGSKSHREHGTTGPGATPSRVYPGTKQAGQMGNVKVKARKLEVLKVNSEKGYIIVKGNVPGKPGNLLRLAPAKIVGKNI